MFGYDKCIHVYANEQAAVVVVNSVAAGVNNKLEK